VETSRAQVPPRAKSVVRPARPSDVKGLSAFFVRAWKEAGPGALGFTGANGEAIREIASIDFLAERLRSPTTQLFVAEEDAGIVGFASLRTRNGECELSGIVVLESAAGRGVGTRLLRKATDTAKRRGFGSVLLKTEMANARAISFYKRNGFTQTGKRTEKVGGVCVPLLILTKRFH
jgi:ribosomal protein S18 acetylase RimI-like enzyme